MSDEFKNLDQLIKRTIPEQSHPLRPLLLPSKKGHWIKGIALSVSLASVIVINLSIKEKNRNESLIALYDTLSWDVTSEETTELEEVMEFIE
jgi:hypothetical protein